MILILFATNYNNNGNVDACVGREEEDGVGVGVGVYEEFLMKHQYFIVLWV